MLRKNVKNLIKRNKLIFPMFLNIFRKNAGFHSDRMMMEVIKEISRVFPISSFIETGTYRGNSSSYIARVFPQLPVFTCEVVEEFFGLSSKRLKKHPNIKIFHQSSEKFLNSLSLGETGSFPLFFLDAHWYDYWPLRDELNIINSKFNKAIIIIDDFQVPGREDFVYNIEGDNLICNFDYIKDDFSSNQTIDLLYPNYFKEESKTRKLTGYGIIFKNLRTEFAEFIKNPWIKDNFKVESY